jgi:hypothetical protein
VLPDHDVTMQGDIFVTSHGRGSLTESEAQSKWRLSFGGFLFMLINRLAKPCYTRKMKGKDNSANASKLRASEDGGGKGEATAVGR